MKNLLLLLAMTIVVSSYAQRDRSGKVGWFLSPEVGGIFHDNHVGRTVGASVGVKLFNDRLKIGLQGYGRSGPINSEEFFIEASDGQTYKGSSTLRLRADHGTFGLFIAPTFQLGSVKLDVPIAIGQLSAGYYLTGEDRNTPDGRRVSEWENELMDGRDVGFGGWIEFGTRVFTPIGNEHVSVGAGLHYTLAPGWDTYYNPSGDFYNNRLRFSLVFTFESD